MMHITCAHLPLVRTQSRVCIYLQGRLGNVVYQCAQEERSTGQDGKLGGRGIHVSTQLGHLSGTSGGPRTPKGMGGTPRNWVGHGAWGGVKGEEK